MREHERLGVGSRESEAGQSRRWWRRCAGTLRDLVTPIERKGLVGFVRKNPTVSGEESGSIGKIVHIHGRGWRLIVRPRVDRSGSFGKFVFCEEMAGPF